MKKNQKVKKIRINLFALLFFIALLVLVINVIFNKENSLLSKISLNKINSLVNAITNAEEVTFTNSKNVAYVIDDEPFSVNIKLENKTEGANYVVEYGIGENATTEEIIDSKDISFNPDEEGANSCYIKVKKDGEVIQKGEYRKTIYKINSYKKQFLDELETKGVGFHFFGINYNYFIPEYKALGSKILRMDLFMSTVYKTGSLDFSLYAENLDKILDNGIRVLAILGGTANNVLGEDSIISTEEELQLYTTFASEALKRFPQITDYEIANEPNAMYKTDETMEWYAKMVNNVSKKLKEQDAKVKILSGAISYGGGSTVKGKDFIEKISKFGAYKNSNLFSYHIYDFSKTGLLNNEYKTKINENINTASGLGGFIKNANTEFGGSTYTTSLSEQEQAEKIVQQYVIADKNNIEYTTIYNFRNSGDDINQKEDNFGLTKANLNPKPAYYSAKTYYENINGAEYIGEVNIADGIEAHVYDKDGKPKIIAWATNTNNQNIKIEYKDFTAKDIYGKNINQDENNELTITTSPVYIENISNKYLYEAISNMIVTKYNELENNFSVAISNVEGLQEKITNLKQIAENIKENTEVEENEAIELMKQHYDLGNIILQASKDGNLQIEYLNLSSILDKLNDIGNSFEDLVTITAKNREIDFTETNKIITDTEKIINDNQDLDILYPSKILDFSKELYEKSVYINNLVEENDIKTGLIVSNNLHGKLLADWANSFSNLYIDKYIKNNPVEIEYSTEELTNEDVKATIVTNADIQVTNNSGKMEYVFTNNDEFTFTYLIKGQEKNITATVNNIDKKSPEITGVENNGLYIGEVLPIIKDINLKEVTLYLNSSRVANYKLGNEITEEGFYRLVANDKVGNKTEVEFVLIENIPKEYEISEPYILNIKSDTTKKQFENNFETNINYEIKRNNKTLTNNEKIATGDTLKLADGIEYTLIVNGDINKDGTVNIKDIMKLRKYLIERKNLDEISLKAADCNFDSQDINMKDLTRIRLLVLARDVL